MTMSPSTRTEDATITPIRRRILGPRLMSAHTTKREMRLLTVSAIGALVSLTTPRVISSKAADFPLKITSVVPHPIVKRKVRATAKSEPRVPKTGRVERTASNPYRVAIGTVAKYTRNIPAIMAPTITIDPCTAGRYKATYPPMMKHQVATAV